MPKDTALRKYLDARVQVLKRQRTSWEPGWRDLSRYVNPGRGQFFTQPNQGDRGTQNKRRDPRPHGSVRARNLGGRADVGCDLASSPVVSCQSKL